MRHLQRSSIFFLMAITGIMIFPVIGLAQFPPTGHIVHSPRCQGQPLQTPTELLRVSPPFEAPDDRPCCEDHEAEQADNRQELPRENSRQNRKPATAALCPDGNAQTRGMEGMREIAELLAFLRDPRESLTAFGYVMGQKEDEKQQIDFYAITDKLQATIVSYFADPPRDPVLNQTLWLVVLGPRQVGKSTMAELSAFPFAAFTPGWDHVCIADTKDRADYLHGRLHYLYDHWPDEFKPPRTSAGNRETRQMTFDPRIGGQMRTLSMNTQFVGIGQSGLLEEVAELRVALRVHRLIQRQR